MINTETESVSHGVWWKYVSS